METIIIILLCLISLYIGYTIAKGIDNNHRELFQAYMDEQIKLQHELNYYKKIYRTLTNELKNNTDLIEDTIIDMQGNIIGVIYKQKNEDNEKE